MPGLVVPKKLKVEANWGSEQVWMPEAGAPPEQEGSQPCTPDTQGPLPEPAGCI